MSLMAELGEAPPPLMKSEGGDKNRSSGHLFDRPMQQRAIAAPITLPSAPQMLPNTLPPPAWTTATPSNHIPNVTMPPPPPPPGGTVPMGQGWPAMMPPAPFPAPPPPPAVPGTTAATTATSVIPPPPPPLMPPWPTTAPMMPPMWPTQPTYPVKTSATPLPASLPSSVLMAPPPPPPPPPS